MRLNPFSWPFRGQYLAGFVCCVALLAYALYAQYEMGKDPCPLCIFQRIAFMGMALFFLIGGLHAPKAGGRKVYAILVALCGLVGMGIAGRHVWLTHLPKDQVPDCGPGLGYMLDTFPLGKTLSLVLTGSGECAEVNWFFLGLSMPAWCLVWFIGLTLGALWAGFRRSRPLNALR